MLTTSRTDYPADRIHLYLDRADQGRLGKKNSQLVTLTIYPVDGDSVESAADSEEVKGT
jgi:hypothetical protein